MNITPYLFDFNEITSLDTEIMEKFPETRKCVDFILMYEKKELRNFCVKKEQI